MARGGKHSAAGRIVLLQSFDLQQRSPGSTRCNAIAGHRRDGPRRRGANARGKMTGGNGNVRRLVAAAVLRDQRTARREMATGQVFELPQARHLVRHDVKRAPLGAQRRIGELQAARIRMCRRGEHGARRPALDGAASIHHGDLVAQLRGKPQVVGDEDDRGAVGALHVGDQL